MNKLCDICDTKNRLHMCNGKCENFKYCFRKVGSLDYLEESIQPFNNIQELKSNAFLQETNTNFDKLRIEKYDENIGILFEIIECDIPVPRGFIIMNTNEIEK